MAPADSRRPRLYFRNDPAQLGVSFPDIRVQGSVGYEAGDLVEVGYLVCGNAVEFCGLAQVIHLRAVFHHRALAVGLDVAGRGQAELQIDAVGAQIRLGKMQLGDLLQACHSLDGARALDVIAADNHQIVIAVLGQHIHHVQGIGHHRQIGRRETLGHQVGGGAGPKKDGAARAHQGGGNPRHLFFLAQIEILFFIVKVILVCRSLQYGAAMGALDEAGVFQGRQIAADCGLRDIVFPREHGHGYFSVRLDFIQNGYLSLFFKHTGLPSAAAARGTNYNQILPGSKTAGSVFSPLDRLILPEMSTNGNIMLDKMIE